ncbi:hypothetical protein [Lacisediminimonas sp.]|uniref:hypothetical protein n=1 Tax=Lacisediminimonas sp. TaxID=3060582 RepID=UPI002722221F|nr:hypothetical protein [Lacisediminimonas sp.]MDO8298518.1 hypothetical protein [Lacisediminimonas sp.]
MQQTPAAVSRDTTHLPPPPVTRKEAAPKAPPVLQARRAKPLFPEFDKHDAAPDEMRNNDVPASTGGAAASSDDSGMSPCRTTTSSIGSSTTTTSTTTTTTLAPAAVEERGKDESRKVKKQATEKKKMYRRSMEVFAPKKAKTPTPKEIEKAKNRALYDAFNENKEQIAGFIDDAIACEFLHDPMLVLIDAGTNRFWIALEKMLQKSPLSAVSLSRLGYEARLSALPRKLEYFLRQIGGVANLVVATKLEEVPLTDDTGAKFV